MKILVCLNKGVHKSVSSITSHARLGVNPLGPFANFVDCFEIVDIVCTFHAGVFLESLDIIVGNVECRAAVGDIDRSIIAMIFISFFDMIPLRLHLQKQAGSACVSVDSSMYECIPSLKAASSLQRTIPRFSNHHNH
jgi:hypothetical protein